MILSEDTLKMWSIWSVHSKKKKTQLLESFSDSALSIQWPEKTEWFEGTHMEFDQKDHHCGLLHDEIFDSISCIGFIYLTAIWELNVILFPTRRT